MTAPEIQKGVEIRTGAQHYEISYVPARTFNCKRGYYYIFRCTAPARFKAIARFYDEQEAQQFMDLLTALTGGELK